MRVLGMGVGVSPRPLSGLTSSRVSQCCSTAGAIGISGGDFGELSRAAGPGK